MVGLLAPLLAAAGYGTAAKELIFPYILTLAMFGVLALLQQLVRDIYTALRPGHAAADSLIPTLVGFMLMLLASIPLALIWGARSTDLTDIWDQMRRGLTVGDMTISPGSFFTLIVVFTLGYLLTRGAQSAMRTSVLPKTKLDPGGQTAIVAGLGYDGPVARGTRVNNYMIALQAAQDGVGVVLGWKRLVAPFLEDGSLVAFGGYELPAPSSFYITRGPKTDARESVDLLEQWLLK